MALLIRWGFRLAVLAALLLAAAIALDSVVRPESTLMMGRLLTGQSVDRRWVPLSLISPDLVSAVILSEDGQFCRHHGVDWGSLREVLKHGHGSPSRGASTITMQVAKNLFLWPGRSYVRKGIEIPLALILDAVWSKKRILEYYLNIAEWGDGVFGAEAAAQRYFRVGAHALTLRQAALLATALPNPILRNPVHPSRGHRALANRITALMGETAGSHSACVE